MFDKFEWIGKETVGMSNPLFPSPVNAGMTVHRNEVAATVRNWNGKENLNFLYAI